MKTSISSSASWRFPVTGDEARPRGLFKDERRPKAKVALSTDRFARERRRTLDWLAAMPTHTYVLTGNGFALQRKAIALTMLTMLTVTERWVTPREIWN